MVFEDIDGHIIHCIDQWVKCICGNIAGKGYVIDGEGFFCFHCHLKKLEELGIRGIGYPLRYETIKGYDIEITEEIGTDK